MTSEQISVNTLINTDKTKTSPTNATQVCEQIQIILKKYLLEQQPDYSESINEDMSFDFIGLDSLARVNLLTLLEKEFCVSLNPTSAYDFVTVRALAEHVWSVISDVPINEEKMLGDS